MRKNCILLVLIFLCGFFNVSAQSSITVPDEGKVYSLINVGSVRYLTALSEPEDNGWLVYDVAIADRYSTEEERTRQQFKFIPISGKAGKYYIQNVASGKYITQAEPSLDGNDWVAVWADPSDIAAYGDKIEFVITPVEDGKVRIGNQDFQNLLGVDGLENNAYVKCVWNTYSGGDVIMYTWTILEYIAGNADRTALGTSLDNVKNYLSNPAIQVGSAIGQYPQDVYDELLAKQAAAQDVFDDSEATQEEVDAAKAVLDAIFKAFQESLIIIQPEPDKEYYIIYDGEADTKGMSSLDENEDSKAFLNAFSEQQFKFEKVESNDIVYYKIQSTKDGKYLYKDGEYETKWTDDVTVVGDDAFFRITPTGNVEKPKYVLLQVNATGGYLGNDPGTDWWSDVYSNKVANKATYWKITTEKPKDQPQITLNVDMRDEAVSPDGIWVTGNFIGCNWAEPGSNPAYELTDPDGDGIYSVTVEYNKMARTGYECVVANDGNALDRAKNPMEYKFANGKGWANTESFFDDCTLLTNRILGVYTDEVDVPAVKLNLCGTSETEERIKVACVGDSNTQGIGWWILPYKEAWPIQLRGLMGDDYQIQNFGLGGVTLTGWMGTDRHGLVQEFDPNIILINLGTNDANPAYQFSEENYEKTYRNLIDIYSQGSAKPQIYLMTPMKALDETQNNTIVNSICPIIKKLSKELALPLIDFYTETLPWTVNDHYADGLHLKSPEATLDLSKKAASILKTAKPQIVQTGFDLSASADYAEYRWYMDGELLEGETAKKITASVTGSYQLGVKLSATADDVLLSEPLTVVVTPTSLTDLSKEAISIYPNPVKDILTIRGMDETSGVSVKLYDVTGNLLLESTHSELDMSGLNRGVYFLDIAGDVRKVVKQ